MIRNLCFLSFCLLIFAIAATQSQDDICGVASYAKGTVYGGTKAVKNQFPWLVSHSSALSIIYCWSLDRLVALYHKDLKSFICGGTLIGNRHVITGENKMSI